MRASLLARAGSAAAVAVVATSGAVATAGAASAATHHPRRLATSLSLVKRPAVLHRRHVELIAGQLRSHRTPLRGKVLYLDRKGRDDKWIVVGREVTHRFGGVAFVVDPKVKAQYKLVFPGSLNFRSSRSRVVTVRAKA